jgi:hypothetical protein
MAFDAHSPASFVHRMNSVPGIGNVLKYVTHPLTRSPLYRVTLARGFRRPGRRSQPNNSKTKMISPMMPKVRRFFQ